MTTEVIEVAQSIASAYLAELATSAYPIPTSTGLKRFIYARLRENESYNFIDAVIAEADQIVWPPKE